MTGAVTKACRNAVAQQDPPAVALKALEKVRTLGIAPTDVTQKSHDDQERCLCTAFEGRIVPPWAEFSFGGYLDDLS
ncbi:hypothetical protein [Frigoribacterium sp. CFBP 13707]|uniref:hypothetical protein n=1 Tax=Frigoribacterium sp. CFBP 13707 TaxID=2775313 RepID=UPI00177CDC71|nr:hypothetical protein [Frigoribacterium sp. CFBP 13707]MBD8726497.1 hypothetical protein [Frigoribacterium sp. CFBP 13707]